jgi:uncharacterized NAD(P)/FAD-binding protein YdhS
MGRNGAGNPAVAIIGGGLSGTLLAIQLLQRASNLDITVIEPREELGLGIAYSTRESHHLLNVRAGAISALPDRPAHFLGWLTQHSPKLAVSDSFVPRRTYGRYIRDLLDTAKSQANPSVQFEHRRAEAIAVERGGRGIEVVLRDGDIVSTDYAVVALGNSYSSCAPVEAFSASTPAGYFSSPWDPESLGNLTEDGAVVLIGAGLTAVDTILSLQAQGHRGSIHVISRHGLMPQVHGHGNSAPVNFDDVRTLPVSGSIRALLGAVRGKVARVQAQGGDWRAVVDGLRPWTNEIWQGLPVAEQRRFVRHLSAIWDVHRHRMAPEVGDVIFMLMEQGRLCVHAGRVQSLANDREAILVRVKPRHSEKAAELRVARVINCAGFVSHYSKIEHPLLKNLLAAGRISPGVLGIGFKATKEGQLLRPDGDHSEGLFTLGPCRRGPLFESVAVPEIRVQAAEIAQHLVSLAMPKEITSQRNRMQYGLGLLEESIASAASPLA